MLADCEDEGVVHREARTLRLCDVEIVSLGVRCWVASQEFIRRVLACV